LRGHGGGFPRGGGKGEKTASPFSKFESPYSTLIVLSNKHIQAAHVMKSDKKVINFSCENIIIISISIILLIVIDVKSEREVILILKFDIILSLLMLILRGASSSTGIGQFPSSKQAILQDSSLEFLKA